MCQALFMHHLVSFSKQSYEASAIISPLLKVKTLSLKDTDGVCVVETRFKP